MSSVAIRLRASLPEVMAAIRCGHIPPACRDDLLAFLPSALFAAAGRAEIVNEARRAKSEAMKVAVLRMADQVLTDKVRGVIERSQWGGIVWNALHVRCADVGLERRPSRRFIRDTLKTWTPPNGDAAIMVRLSRVTQHRIGE